MNKKVIFRISVLLNGILAVVLVISMAHAMKEIDRNKENHSLWRMANILMEDKVEEQAYGWLGAQTRPSRYGAKEYPNNRNYYRLGEYADLLFFREVYQAGGEKEQAADCGERINELKEELSGQSAVLDKIEQSVQKALKEQ
ncbi:MAG: hypothetical protein E7294_05515 [Lachnospiraceae bacterium]|nr:hypothetical protein [Lachnospiraceae bacterium]